ncbi:E3 ubiquitin-protein ligase Siah1-like [Aethina tumida]|uniref:E3 ubiquitin-protein ligase Siah1-like n=1 Tax=Aethina tumida TaxID=116153 RepID=UPI0021481282|nr:E3 ubiquitin-protein ligase Siah1-like [Aethina tumida]
MYDLISEFKCVVCFDYMKPPIQMCLNGHSCCNSCFRRMNQCPECRGQKSDYRNLNLERICNKLVFPCRNADYGCDFASKGVDVVSHEGKCVYEYMPCPFAEYGCTWSGVYNTMEDHFRDNHYFIYDIPNCCYLRGFNWGANTWHQPLKFEGFLFVLSVIKERSRYWFGVYSIINTDVTYNHELKFMDSTNRTIRFRGICSKRWTTEDDVSNLQSAPGMLVKSFRQGNLVKYKIEIFHPPLEN